MGWLTFQRFSPSGAALTQPTIALPFGNFYDENFPSSHPAVGATLLSNGKLLLDRAYTELGAPAPPFLYFLDV